MEYLQVDLSNVSRPVVRAFKQLPWIESETGGDVIILATSRAQLFVALRNMQLEADCLDTHFEYPTTFTPVNPEYVLNGKTVRQQFKELVSVDNARHRSKEAQTINGYSL